MNKKILTFTILGSLALSPNSSKAWDGKIKYLFEHPRDGKFKVIDWNLDKWDETSKIHLSGSAGLAGSLNFYFDQKKHKKPVLKSILITTGTGLLKECEDGFREGFSRKDLIADVTGTAAGVLVYQGVKYLVKKL